MHKGFYHEIEVGIPDNADELLVSGNFRDDYSHFNELRQYHDKNLHTATPLHLWSLINMVHLTDKGYSVSRGAVIKEYGFRDADMNTSLGLPVHPEYPYVNRHRGYLSVATLDALMNSGHILDCDWWSIHQSYHPIPNFARALELIHVLLMENNHKPRRPAKMKYAHEDTEHRYFNEFNNSELLVSAGIITAYLEKYGENIIVKEINDFLLFSLTL